DEDLKRVMKTNLSGYSMDLPVRVGNLVGRPVSVYVDLAKISSMHMAILGTTGSGKTTFVARLIENTPPAVCKTFVFDLFGEYRQKLRIEESRIHHVRIPYTLLPLWVEDIKELFREYGLLLQEKGEEERTFLTHMRTYIKPDLRLSAYAERGLGDMLLEASKGGLKKEVLEVLRMLSKDMGEEVLQNQPQVFRLLGEALSSPADVVIIDLRDVVNINTRLNMTGLLLREIMSIARSKPSRRLLVLEEAHNFAPERGATEVPAGRENLAISMTKRIALEGRKFGVGLLAVSQRPANLSKYVLSQLNTQAIFRLITQNDINAVSQFFEYPYEDQVRLLPTLKPGHLFLSGIAVPFSMLLEIEL
ncbi:MAG: ATP-binding protein, partial [Aquificaceae bacterium]